MAESAVYSILAVVLAIITTVFIVKCVNCMRREDEWDCMPFMVFTAFLYVPSLCLINLNWLQIWIAPKVYLLEYMANMVTK